MRLNSRKVGGVRYPIEIADCSQSPPAATCQAVRWGGISSGAGIGASVPGGLMTSGLGSGKSGPASGLGSSSGIGGRTTSGSGLGVGGSGRTGMGQVRLLLLQKGLRDQTYEREPISFVPSERAKSAAPKKAPREWKLDRGAISALGLGGARRSAPLDHSTRPSLGCSPQGRAQARPYAEPCEARERDLPHISIRVETGRLVPRMSSGSTKRCGNDGPYGQ